MMKSRCRENARKKKRERQNARRVRRCAQEGRKREEKEIKRGDGERKRFQPDSTHRGEPPPLFLSTSRFSFTVTAHIHTHTRFFWNEPDYWLNPDRGITYSVKSSFAQGEPDGESMRDRDRREGCVHAGLPRRSPSPLSPLAPFVRFLSSSPLPFP